MKSIMKSIREISNNVLLCGSIIQKNKIFKIILLVFFSLAVTSATNQAVAQGGTWITKSPMLTATCGAAAGVINGQLYIISGIPIGGGTTNTMEAYDPATDTWTYKASIPTSRAYGGAGVIDEKLYVVGGCINGDCRIGLTDKLEVYDPVTDTWSTKAPIPTARFSMAVGVINGKLYVVGGSQQCPPCTTLATLEVYDPSTDTWTTKAPMPTARGSMAVGVINSNLFVAGGGNASGVLATLVVYDPATDSWTTRAPMPTALEAAGSGVVNGMLYVVSGINAGGYPHTVEAYDPVSNTWVTDTPIPTARYGPAVGVINGVLYVAGSAEGNLQSAILEAFTPEIIDTTPPVITPTVTPAPNAQGWSNTDVTVSWNVTDPESGIVSSTGCNTTTLTTETASTTLTCSATNAVGLSNSISVTIKIDKTPPTMTCSATPNSLWPPNHKMVNVTTSVTMNDSLSGASGFTLTSVTSNEPDEGLGDGDVANDIQGWAIGTADTAGSLRAERSGSGTGRIYTLSYEGKDAAGNTTPCSVTVKVPHDKGK